MQKEEALTQQQVTARRDTRWPAHPPPSLRRPRGWETSLPSISTMQEDPETLLTLQRANIVAQYHQAHQAGSPQDLSLCKVTDHQGFLFFFFFPPGLSAGDGLVWGESAGVLSPTPPSQGPHSPEGFCGAAGTRSCPAPAPERPRTSLGVSPVPRPSAARAAGNTPQTEPRSTGGPVPSWLLRVPRGTGSGPSAHLQRLEPHLRPPLVLFQKLRQETRHVDKWIKMLKRWDRYLPSEKLRLRVYKGVPPHVRGQEMKEAALVSSRDIMQIDLDVNRTFRSHTMFWDRYGVGPPTPTLSVLPPHKDAVQLPPVGHAQPPRPPWGSLDGLLPQRALFHVLAAYSMYDTVSVPAPAPCPAGGLVLSAARSRPSSSRPARDGRLLGAGPADDRRQARHARLLRPGLPEAPQVPGSSRARPPKSSPRPEEAHGRGADVHRHLYPKVVPAVLPRPGVAPPGPPLPDLPPAPGEGPAQPHPPDEPGPTHGAPGHGGTIATGLGAPGAPGQGPLGLTLAHRPERLLKLPLEGLREFLQDSLAQPWALEDEAVLRHLRASMTQLRGLRCDLPPPAGPEEFPTRPLGLEQVSPAPGPLLPSLASETPPRVEEPASLGPATQPEPPGPPPSQAIDQLPPTAMELPPHPPSATRRCRQAAPGHGGLQDKKWGPLPFGTCLGHPRGPATDQALEHPRDSHHGVPPAP
ncbi:proline-rich protein 36-like [Canis lupus dingo]|uniref:proline-rich protein 36-like n=1 Tax=Canis lupus dingo TaxID=286419 RepID=UPI0020C1D413|nr:proline-rich protein 36-like [Canis lupus dingo]